MERKEAIRGAYRMTGGNSFYDGMITCSTLSGKAVCRLVWAMNKAENDAYLEKAMSGIPEHFSGKLLEVPVGKGRKWPWAAAARRGQVMGLLAKRSDNDEIFQHERPFPHCDRLSGDRTGPVG